MILFTFDFFPAISIMGDEYGDMSCFKIPKCTKLCISLSIIGLSSLTCNGLMKSGDLFITCTFTSIFEQITIFSLKTDCFSVLNQ